MAFRARIFQKLGLQGVNRDPGFLRYCEVFREQQRRSLFVGDVGAVPKGKTFAHSLPCGLAHPGLCAAADVAIVGVAKAIADHMYLAIGPLPVGTFFHLRVCVGDAWQRTTWFVLAHRRGAGPRMVMVAPASLDSTTLRLSLDFDNSLYDFMMAVTFIGLILKVAPRDRNIVVQWAQAPIDEGVLLSRCDEVQLRRDWSGHVASSESTLYPAPVPLRKDHAAANMAKG